MGRDDGMREKTKILNFPYIRVAACVGIVLLHILFASNIYFADSMSGMDNVVSKSVENLLMWCVPCFLMVTGALLLDPQRELPYKKLFHKYLRRVVIALMIFTLIFRLIDGLLGELPLSPEILLPDWLYRMFTSQSWAHVWYLYLLIGLYLLMPFYRVIAKHCSDRELYYLIVVYIVFISLLPLLQIVRWNSGFYLATNLIYPGYLFLGYMIHHRKLEMDRSTAWLLVIGCSALIIMLTIFRYNYGETIFGKEMLALFDKNLFGYHSILVIGQAAGIFTLLDKKSVKKNGPVITLLDQCGFGAYLIHMIFIHIVLKHMGVNPYEYGGAMLFLLMTVAFYILAVGITWLLRLIPLVRQVL